MKYSLRTLGSALFIALAIFSPLLADSYLESLQPDQVVHGFRTVNLYDNSSGQALGARFASEKYGFIIDLMQIQSVPQAFYWIKTPITSSKGEPHACEHLLLGKGNRGRYVAALEDMALANSTAYTGQTRTCYHFNTTAGEDTFYEIFEAKLQALLHPDFTDEEIRREVCHIGVVVDPQDGSLSLEEKGTVYTEMVSAFEKPWYYIYSAMNKLVFGEDHPLSNISGGDPDVMRSMVPEDLWKFHKATHHLANMGVICSVPDNISVETFLERTDKILARCQDYPDSSSLIGIGAYDFPPVSPAPVGTTVLATYPSDRLEDPGYFIYAWPTDLELDYKELFVLELFLQTFARGETSDLYDLFINSQTRKIDLGANSVRGDCDTDLGISIYFDLTGVDNINVNKTMVDSVRLMILTAIRRVHDLADNSDELREFNKRVKNRLIENRKRIENNLNRPPMFGFRTGPAGNWLRLMKDIEDEKGFRKSLVFKDRFAFADSLLSQECNPWKVLIDHWRLLTVAPYCMGASPSPDILTKKNDAKQTRLVSYIEDFKRKYGVQDEQEAITKYKKKFDAKTADLEALASKDELPAFTDNPPMTLDDQLQYETITLPSGVPMVASTFENMSSSRVGLALRLDVVPESLLVYVPYLPSVLTDIGVVRDGEVIEYNEMQERLRQEVLDLGARFDFGFERGRIEIVLFGDGGNLEELNNVLGWLDAALYSPYLSADNLPRMVDLIDQSLLEYRNRTKAPEERWVSIPANAYRFQKDPLFLSTNCFFTQVHHYQRLKWLLTDPGDATQRKGLAAFIDALADEGRDKNRDQLIALLSGYENAEVSGDLAALAGLTGVSKKTIGEIVRSFKLSLADIPDGNLSSDWEYLCKETKADLMVRPEATVARIRAVLDLVRRSDNARMFMISSSSNREAVLKTIRHFVRRLDSSQPAVRQQYAEIDRVTWRLASREPGVRDPVYVGLVHEGTQNGVLLFSAKVAGEYDTSSASVLNCLSGKLYGGGGPHGLFMKTWAAGLAYSNGYGYNQATGRVSYYAERCPDVAETMRFVVDQLKNAEDDPGLTDYAVAQVFGFSHAPSRYEQRGQAMASDLTDGFTPEKVRAYRQKVLDMRHRDHLYEEVKARMEAAYGPVLIGYDAPLSESENGNFFIIGPKSQFESLEAYIEMTEEKQTVYRLYPRDFWLTM